MLNDVFEELEALDLSKLLVNTKFQPMSKAQVKNLIEGYGGIDNFRVYSLSNYSVLEETLSGIDDLDILSNPAKKKATSKKGTTKKLTCPSGYTLTTKNGKAVCVKTQYPWKVFPRTELPIIGSAISFIGNFVFMIIVIGGVILLAPYIGKAVSGLGGAAIDLWGKVKAYKSIPEAKSDSHEDTVKTIETASRIRKASTT